MSAEASLRVGTGFRERLGIALGTYGLENLRPADRTTQNEMFTRAVVGPLARLGWFGGEVFNGNRVGGQKADKAESNCLLCNAIEVEGLFWGEISFNPELKRRIVPFRWTNQVWPQLSVPLPQDCGV